MTDVSFIRRCLIGVATLAASLAVAGPACATLNQSWNGWKWSRTGSLEIKVGNNLSGVWQPYLTAAISQWNADPVIDFVAAAGNCSSGTTCNATCGMIQACSGSHGFNGWLGYACVWTSNTRIVQATIRMSDNDFASSKYNTAAWRAMTMCHELGHTIGLNHAGNTRSMLNIGSCADLDSTKLASTMPSLTSGSGLTVPEPETWTTLILGFGLTGLLQRRHQRIVA